MSDLDAAAEQTLLASRALLGVVARSIEPALEEVSLPQFRVLVLLTAYGPMRSGAVAERMGIHPSTFSRNADRLVAGGWVRRVEDPESRLSVLVEPTERARLLVERVTLARRERIVEILGRMPAEQRAVLGEALGAFAQAAGEPSLEELSVLGL
ncbi:MarR family winged helix-turn-helix transcriptional regulator [Actinotalea sp.]|uniref:MarR family winged helix-turn-helix transcriptional regulator n=1 Tax=Actinotalea sp. TaxID=1872145 RepID=UPI003564ABA6